jgi:two-component sensor histidine kinase
MEVMHKPFALDVLSARVIAIIEALLRSHRHKAQRFRRAISAVAASLSSLALRATLFVALVCLTVLGLDIRQVWMAHDARLQQAETETANLARSLAQHAQDVLEGADVTLKGLRGTVAEDGTAPVAMSRMSRRMHARLADQQKIQRLFLYDENGNWLASSLDARAFDVVRGLNYADRGYFQRHRDHAEDVVQVGEPIQTKLNGARVITISRRLSHPDGSFAGVVGASIGLEQFQDFFQTFDIGRQGAITLTSGSGILMVRRPFDVENVGRSIAQSQFFQAIQEHADTGSFEFVSFLDGRARLGSFHRVDGFDLIMIVALDKNEVLERWWDNTRIHLVWLSFIVIFIALLGYRMTVQIRYRAAAEAQLAASRQTLERRVVERTADLRQMVTQRDLLLREVYHRVKNNMQVVDALLAMEEKRLTDAEARQMLADMRTRVLALGLAHRQLMVSVDLETFDIAPFLQELADSILASRIDTGADLLVEANSLMVTLDFAVPVGLVVSELVTNCLQHAFLAGNGLVTVKLNRNSADDVVLTVSDNGAPVTSVDPEAGKAAQRARIIRGLVGQIDGIINVHTEDGSHTEIVIPARELPK